MCFILSTLEPFSVLSGRPSPDPEPLSRRHGLSSVTDFVGEVHVLPRRCPLALCGLLLMGSAWAPAQPAPPSERSSQESPPRKPTPSFTDDDLARYREERLRRQSVPTEPAPSAGEPLPPATPPARGPGPRALSVELLDLNRSLPPEARTAAEATARRFVTFFKLSFDGPLVIPLRYFPDPAAYRDHLDRNGIDVDWAGYYDPRKREIVVGNARNYLAVLVHEINHFVFDTAFDEAPVWLREGLAEYFETASASADGLLVADQLRHRRQIAEWLTGSRQPDLRQLLALNRSMWRDHEVAGSQRVRALSWSVVDFLMASAAGRKALQDFMAALKDQRGLYSLQAFNRTFPGGAASFERQWLAHVQTLAPGD